MLTASLRLIKGLKPWIIPTYIWDGRVEARDLEIRVGGRGPVPLHGDQPGRGNLVGILDESGVVSIRTLEPLIFEQYKVSLTGPMGMPRAIRSSSERSPGFFSFSRVSNSFPCRHKQQTG